MTHPSTCFYPVPDPKFDLEGYLGTWYQIAGTPFGPTAGASCVTANYQLNVRARKALTESYALID